MTKHSGGRYLKLQKILLFPSLTCRREIETQEDSTCVLVNFILKIEAYVPIGTSSLRC